MFLGTTLYAFSCQLIYFVILKGFIKIILQHQVDFGTIVHTHISLSCSFLNSLRYTKAEQQEAIRTCSQWVKNIYRFVFEFWSTDFFYSTNLIRRAVGKFENPGVPVLFGGHNLPPLVEIGLSDLPKFGGVMAPLAPPGTTGLIRKGQFISKCPIGVNLRKSEKNMTKSQNY